MWAYDVEEKSNKLFNIKRIERVQLLPQTWRYEAGHAIGAIDIFRISSFKQVPLTKFGVLA